MVLPERGLHGMQGIAVRQTLDGGDRIQDLQHAERIGASIAEVLKTAGVDSGRISAVVVGRGPAPFTGLRIGIAAGMMFAEGSGAKLGPALDPNGSTLDPGPDLYAQLLTGLADAMLGCSNP